MTKRLGAQGSTKILLADSRVQIDAKNEWGETPLFLVRKLYLQLKW